MCTSTCCEPHSSETSAILLIDPLLNLLPGLKPRCSPGFAGEVASGGTGFFTQLSHGKNAHTRRANSQKYGCIDCFHTCTSKASLQNHAKLVPVPVAVVRLRNRQAAPGAVPRVALPFGGGMPESFGKFSFAGPLLQSWSKDHVRNGQATGNGHRCCDQTRDHERVVQHVAADLCRA